MSDAPRRPSAPPRAIDEAAGTEVYDPGRHEDRRAAVAVLDELGEPLAIPDNIPKVAPYSARPERSEPVRAISYAERSEPVRAISMKAASEPSRPHRAPPQVQLRAIAEVARTPNPQGRLAPPRDGRAARARQHRQNILWVLGGLVLAAAIAVTIYLIAG